MTEHREHARRSWAKFVNPEVLRGNLIAASMFLAAYEILRASVIDRIRSFFCSRFRDGKWVPDDDYRTKCLALDKSPLRASLLWLKQMSAIDDTDMAQVDELRCHRNDLAHDLPRFLATAGAEVNVQLLGRIYELIAKIDRWWFREVDGPTDPGYDSREVVDENVTSGNMLFIQMMMRIAVGGDPGVFWQAFQKHWGDTPEERSEKV